MRSRRWNREDLVKATKESKSIRAIISALHLVPAGGNYAQVQKYLREYKIDTSHLKGSAWNKGLRGLQKSSIPLKEVLCRGTTYQSFKLKQRLFVSGIKKPVCELCGWAKHAMDGRLPLELDHVNGDRYDNRLENLRILCPNCHSLQPTHRGKNQTKHKARMAELVDASDLRSDAARRVGSSPTLGTIKTS